MRPTVSAAIAVAAFLATGCANAGVDTIPHLPQNEGANADVRGVMHVRNAFLIAGTDPASPAPQQSLYAVLINAGTRPDQLDRVTVEGGGSVQLAGPVSLPPNQPVGTGGRPIGTVTGVRGGAVPMTFDFRQAGSVRVMVPVKYATGQYATLTPSP
ncbi:hypothetical protein ITP53_51845, partial [Nonomuraea sp. K274]